MLCACIFDGIVIAFLLSKQSRLHDQSCLRGKFFTHCRCEGYNAYGGRVIFVERLSAVLEFDNVLFDCAK